MRGKKEEEKRENGREEEEKEEEEEEENSAQDAPSGRLREGVTDGQTYGHNLS